MSTMKSIYRPPENPSRQYLLDLAWLRGFSRGRTASDSLARAAAEECRIRIELRAKGGRR